MLTLRSPQEVAVSSVIEWLNTPGTRSGLVVAPVAFGKSLLMAEIAKRVSAAYPRMKILLLSHVKELLEQDGEAIKTQWPEADLGYYSDSMGQKRLHHDITVAGIQSVCSQATNFDRPPMLVMIDECDLVSHNEDTVYRKFIKELEALNPYIKFVGFTGTPFRADSGRLDEGDGRMFEDVIYEINIKTMMDMGYLCVPVTPKNLVTQMDITGVGTSGGDYIGTQLQKAVDKDEVIKKCVDEIVQYGASRNTWLVFTAGVEHCEHVRDEIRSRGITCEMLTGGTDKKVERPEIMEDFKAGRIKCLVNVAVATRGTNVPNIDMIAFMRPTRSPVLYMQMAGRGLRLHPSKQDCLFLDFGGVIRELGPIDAIDIRRRASKAGGEKGAPVTKKCPKCGELCMGGQKYCYACSYEFLTESSIDDRSDKHSDMLTISEPEMKSVIGMKTVIHANKNDKTKPDTLRVNYICMDNQYSDFICFGHKGYARDRAVTWHKLMRPDLPVPNNAEEASLITYPTPSEIEVRKEGKYSRVTRVVLPDDQLASLSSFDPNVYEEIPF